MAIYAALGIHHTHQLQVDASLRSFLDNLPLNDVLLRQQLLAADAGPSPEPLLARQYEAMSPKR